MTIKDRKPAHRVQRISRGQPITALFLNALVDGTNEALAPIEPPKSLKRPRPTNQINEVSDIITGERRFVEFSKKTTTLIVECPNDPDTNHEVTRIDEISFQDGEDILTLVLDWS